MKIETFADEADFVVPHTQTRYGLGLFGLLVAIVGLALAIARPHIAEALKPPPVPEQKLSEKLAKAGEKFVDRTVAKVRGKPAAIKAEPPQLPERPWLLYFGIAAFALGFVGSLAGMVGWIRHESPRLVSSAIVVGALAVAWVYIMAALVSALVIFFLFLLISAFGGSS